MLGIALGVMVLITVLSVMNGFNYEISGRVFNMAQQVTVTNMMQQIPDWQGVKNKVQKEPQVSGVAPFVSGQALLANSGTAKPVILTGILPNEEKNVSKMFEAMTKGSFNDLKPGQFGIILGESMAEGLGLQIGDKVTVLTTDVNVSPIGVMPQYKRFTVTGLFHAEGGFNIDDSIGFIEMHDAQKLFKLQNNVSGLRLKLTDVYSAPMISERLQSQMPEFSIGNWTQGMLGSYFKAIQMEKSMMFIILTLIIGIAAFNLVSTLVMVVTDKRSEIAILRTLGASPATIMAIFMVQGGIVGVIGTLLGIGSGILLALNAPAMVQGLQSLLHTHFISSSVYFIDYLPSRLEWRDVFQISGIALFLSFIATIYPAWQASRTEPVEALRYE